MKKVILLSILFFNYNALLGQEISGSWNWQHKDGIHQTEITLIKIGDNSFEGYYCSSFYDGKKIDCTFSNTEVCINIEKISENTYQGNFNSPSFNGNGEVKFVFQPSNNSLKVEILNSENEFYLPTNVFFIR